MSSKSESPQVGISFPQTVLDIVDAAADKAGKSRSAFVREASAAMAASLLGVPVPTIDTHPGRRTPISLAAAAHGLDVKTYTRQCAEIVQGTRAAGAFEVPAPKAEETPAAA